ncbi:hypothetical protein DFH11DRAFT_1880659 [Phellopilus nigrolimitatus]|nr:hypothetical protein DFH11DRAFT_1880659 [Phellopilus nigrolimitatus]
MSPYHASGLRQRIFPSHSLHRCASHRDHPKQSASPAAFAPAAQYLARLTPNLRHASFSHPAVHQRPIPLSTFPSPHPISQAGSHAPFNIYVHPDFAYQPYEKFHGSAGAIAVPLTFALWVLGTGVLAMYRFAPETLAALLKPLGLGEAL